MAAPAKPWKAEYAKSARSSCKTCKSPIVKEILRLGKMVQAKQFDGFMPIWNHASCVLKKPKQIKSVDDVEGIDTLRWEDQQKIRKCVEGSATATATATTTSVDTVTAMQYDVELSPTSRATCKSCSQKVMKGEVHFQHMLVCVFIPFLAFLCIYVLAF